MTLIRNLRKGVEQRVPEATKPYLNRFYRPLMDAVFKYKYGNFDSLTVSGDGVEVEFDTSQTAAKNWFFPGMADGSFHEPVVTRKLLDCLDSISVFFDVGANVGYFSVVAAEVCSEVHSFEIDPTLCSIVESNFARNQLNGHIINKAVAGQSGMDVSFSPHQSGNPSTNKLSTDTHSGVKITTIALDDYTNESRVSPDVVKIDVEGAEGQVLAGAERIFNNDVEHIFLEIHPEHIDSFGYGLEDISEFLSDWGYSCAVFSSHRSESRPDDVLQQVGVTEIQNIEKNTMFFCSRNN